MENFWWRLQTLKLHIRIESYPSGIWKETTKPTYWYTRKGVEIFFNFVTILNKLLKNSLNVLFPL